MTSPPDKTRPVSLAPGAQMIRAALALVLLTSHASIPAAVYQCQVGGNAAYQSEPCPGGREVPIRGPAPGVAKTDKVDKAACPSDSLNLDFRNIALPTVMEVIANFSGRRAQTDPTVDGSAPIHYACTPWRQVLDDLAQRHHLDIRIEDTRIVVKKR